MMTPIDCRRLACYVHVRMVKVFHVGQWARTKGECVCQCDARLGSDGGGNGGGGLNKFCFMLSGFHSRIIWATKTKSEWIRLLGRSLGIARKQEGLWVVNES